MQFTDEWLVHTIEPLLPDGTVAAIRQEPASAPGVALGDPGPAQADRRRPDPEGHRHPVPVPHRRPEPHRPQAPAERAGAGGPAVQRRARRPDRFLPRGRHRQSVRHRRREDAGLRHRARGPHAARLAGDDPPAHRRAVPATRTPVNRLLEGIGDDFDVRELQEDEEEAAASAEEASQRPIIRLVDVMLADGVTSRASDIHVEPIEGGVVVRYRIDGVLRQVMKIPRNAGPAPHLPHQDHVRASTSPTGSGRRTAAPASR